MVATTCSANASLAMPLAYPLRVGMIRLMRLLLIVFAAGQLVLGLLLWLTPGFFYDEIGPYPPRNDHYMGDVASFYLALGAVALASVSRERWRVPVLTLALIQYALHSLNHLIDIGGGRAPARAPPRRASRRSAPPPPPRR